MVTYVFRSLIPAALLAALVFAVPALTQTASSSKDSKQKEATSDRGDQSDQGNSSQQDDSSRDSNNSDQSRSIQGEVVSTHDAKMAGSKDPGTVATIKTKDGQRMVVDLGAKSGLAKLNLKEGSKVTVRGRVVRIGNVQVVLADRISAGEQNVSVRRPNSDLDFMTGGSGSRASQGYMVIMTNRRVSGTIQATKKLSLRDSETQNMLASLKTKSGRKLIVDLGPVKELEAFNLKKGDEIAASGYSVDVGGKRILLAHEVEYDGETVEIDREGQVMHHQHNGQHQSGQQNFQGQQGYQGQQGQQVYQGQPVYQGSWTQPAYQGQPIYQGQPYYQGSYSQPSYQGYTQPAYQSSWTQPVYQGQPYYQGQQGYSQGYTQPYYQGQQGYQGNQGYTRSGYQGQQGSTRTSSYYQGQPGSSNTRSGQQSGSSSSGQRNQSGSSSSGNRQSGSSNSGSDDKE